MNIHRTTSIAFLVLVASGLVSTEALAAQSASGQAKVRDHRQSETSVSLKVNQRLMLTNGDYVERSADGTVNIIQMNGRVVKGFPQGKIVKSKSGGISIISGKQRVQAGEFKAIEANVVRRDQRTESANEQIIAPNNRTGTTQDHRTARTSENETSFDEADAIFSRRVHRTEPDNTRSEVRDHRRSETPVSLKVNQLLVLTYGNYVERVADGTVNIVRPFPQGKIVKDKSGGISIISGKKREQAGEFKEIKASAGRRDHRTESDNTRSDVRDHRQSETPVNLKANERLLLRNGNYVEHLADGTVNIVRPFPKGKIVQDKSGAISIISGQRREQAGVFKSIEVAELFE